MDSDDPTYNLLSQDYEREAKENEITFHNIQVVGKIGTTTTLLIKTNSLNLELRLEILLQPCPAGYYRDEQNIYKCEMCPSGMWKFITYILYRNL